MAGLGFSLATLLTRTSRKLYVEEDSRIGFKRFFQDAANSLIDDEKTNLGENHILANFRLFFVFRYFKVVVPRFPSIMVVFIR